MTWPKGDKASPAQVVQRHRFVYKGFLTGTLSRVNQILTSRHLVGVEIARLELLRKVLQENIKYVDGWTKILIRGAK